jgi:YHS domain-containing protein
MEVDIATARWTTDFAGQTIYFCAPSCKRTFVADPTLYAIE